MCCFLINIFIITIIIIIFENNNIWRKRRNNTTRWESGSRLGYERTPCLRPLAYHDDPREQHSCNKTDKRSEEEKRQEGMAARQVLGSLRLPLAPRGTAMDGGETAKSVVTMTKDFKAYVQHLQDEKFNSRNIACNGMRRLIVSHSKSTSSYTPDEMIKLLKTVESLFERLAK